MIPCDNRDEEELFQARIPIPLVVVHKNRNPSTTLKQLHSSTSDNVRHLSSHAEQISLMQYPSHHHHVQDQDDVQVEGFLPIKKRRLKEAGNNLQENVDAMYYCTSSSQSAAIDSDNSEQWWYHANRQYSANNNRRAINNANSSLIVPTAMQMPAHDLNQEEQQTQSQHQQQEGSQSNAHGTNSNTRSSTVPEKPQYHKDDPRSDEYQKWLRLYYSNNRVSSPSSNTLLNRLRLVNPAEAGGYFPPWITQQKLKQWDITQPIPILSRSEYNINTQPLKNKKTSSASLSRTVSTSVQPQPESFNTTTTTTAASASHIFDI